MRHGGRAAVVLRLGARQRPLLSVCGGSGPLVAPGEHGMIGHFTRREHRLSVSPGQAKSPTSVERSAKIADLAVACVAPMVRVHGELHRDARDDPASPQPR